MADIPDSTTSVAKSSRCTMASLDDLEYIAKILAQQKGNTYKPSLGSTPNVHISVGSQDILPTSAPGQIVPKYILMPNHLQVVHPPLIIFIYFFPPEAYEVRCKKAMDVIQDWARYAPEGSAVQCKEIVDIVQGWAQNALQGYEVQCNKVMKVVQDWAQYAHVSFLRTDKPKKALIRIRFKSSGCSESLVGLQNYTETRPEMDTMAFGPQVTHKPEITAYEKHLILHEFGHVLGLYHEHQTPAGLGVLTLNEENIKRRYSTWKDWEIELQITHRHQLQSVISFSRIDLDSVMTYPLFKDMSVEEMVMNQNSELSKWDKAFMVIHFPRIGDPTEDADGTRWTIEVALDLLGVVDEDDLEGELLGVDEDDEGFTPLVAKYREEGEEEAQDLPAAIEDNPNANARLRILDLYGQLREAVEALAGHGSISDRIKAYIKTSTAITTRMRNVFGEWTHRKYLASKDHPERRKPINSNRLVSEQSAAYLEFLYLLQN